MHIPTALRVLEDGFCLGAGETPCLAHADAALGIFAEVDVPFALQIRRALSRHAAELAALAGGNADAVSRLVQPVGDLLIFHALGLVLNRRLHGDRAHERLPHGHRPRDLLLQIQYVIEEGRCSLRERVRALLGHDGALHGAGGEHRQLYPIHAVIVAVILQQTDVHQVVGHLRRRLHGHALELCKLIDVVHLAQLHFQREVHLRVGKLPVEEDVLPALLAGQGIEHVDVPYQLDQIFPRRFAAFLPVLLQTFLFAFCENMVCHIVSLP